MAVLRPLKLVVENYPEGQVEELDAVNNPEDPAAGTRKVPFSRELYIEQDDFREAPPKKYFRLAPGAEVRLRYAYIVQCTDVEGRGRRGRRGALHLRSRHARRRQRGRARSRARSTGCRAAHAVDAEVRLYDTLFTEPEPDDAEDFRTALNPKVAEVLRAPQVEPALAGGRRGRTSVRAHRLLLRRTARDSHARPPRLQPHRRAARHVGQDREQGLTGAAGRGGLPSRPFLSDRVSGRPCSTVRHRGRSPGSPALRPPGIPPARARAARARGRRG